MKKDHSCQAKECIRNTQTACVKCGFFYCDQHLKDHNCEKEESWQTLAPTMNSIMRDLDSGKIKLKPKTEDEQELDQIEEEEPEIEKNWRDEFK